MIEKVTDFGSLSGVLSPLLPLVYADGSFSQNDLDGAFFQKSEYDELQAVLSLKNTCVTLIVISEDGIEELENWNPLEICSLLHTTKDYQNTLPNGHTSSI